MGETENDDRPGPPETLRELYDVVPATEDYDAPPTPGQAQGMVEHLLDAEIVEPADDTTDDPDDTDTEDDGPEG